jgi:hypothetical protein
VKKKAAIRISKTDTSKNKFFYKYNNRSCDNTFIDWCNPMNDTELTIGEGGDVIDINRILEQVKKKIKINCVEFRPRITI